MKSPGASLRIITGTRLISIMSQIRSSCSCPARSSAPSVQSGDKTSHWNAGIVLSGAAYKSASG